jgi:hypothetical protein
MFDCFYRTAALPCGACVFLEITLAAFLLVLAQTPRGIAGLERNNRSWPFEYNRQAYGGNL